MSDDMARAEIDRDEWREKALNLARANGRKQREIERLTAERDEALGFIEQLRRDVQAMRNDDQVSYTEEVEKP